MDTTLRPSWDGRFFEDFAIGDHFRHPLGRTISATDNAWFTLQTMNTNQFHFNDHYASHSLTGEQIVNPGLTVAMVLGISVGDISQNAIANPGWTAIEAVHPVLVGETLCAESVVTDLRLFSSRARAGIVHCFTRGLNQHGTVVLSYRRTVLVHRRDSSRRCPRTSRRPPTTWASTSRQDATRVMVFTREERR